MIERGLRGLKYTLYIFKCILLSIFKYIKDKSQPLQRLGFGDVGNPLSKPTIKLREILCR